MKSNYYVQSFLLIGLLCFTVQITNCANSTNSTNTTTTATTTTETTSIVNSSTYCNSTSCICGGAYNDNITYLTVFYICNSQYYNRVTQV